MLGAGAVAGFGLLGVILCALWAGNFLLFHTIAETFAVVVAFAAAVVAWYSRDWVGRNYLLLLGVSQFFVGGLDILHTVSYKGVGVLDARGGNLPTEFWLAGRAFEAICFLIAVWSPQRRYGDRQLVAALMAAWVLVVGTIFADLWPAAFVPGVGVTPFKMGAEFVLVAILVGVLVRVRRRAADYDPQIYSLLLLSIVCRLLTELSFAFYIDVFGLAHLVGHTFKIVGSWAFLKAVVDSGLRRPQSLIFGALARERTLSGEVAMHAQTLDAVLDATLDPVVMFDAEGRFRFASRAAQLFLDRGSQELVGRTWREAGLPESLMVAIEELVLDVLADGDARTREICLNWHGGRLCLELQTSPVGGGVRPNAAVVVIRDITAHKALEEDLKASLEDNRVLTQEVHHRVKNNLQIVSSILQMQGWRMADPELRQHFDEACGRILSLAKVHELIYKQENLASVDFALYVRTLCSELFRMHSLREDRVVLNVGGDAMALAVGKAEPLALIVHELVVEALKHGFGEGGGRLRVDLSVLPSGDGVLRVADDGGRPDRVLDFESNSAALGLRMVGALVRQLHGSIALHRGNGIEVEISFPLREVPVTS
ncbi:MAG TPA: MASE3 domain-containing protein [Magnetospirillum sp.]|nr:MASE3 domain-containing protein [Magnetospirillum sp.]